MSKDEETLNLRYAVYDYAEHFASVKYSQTINNKLVIKYEKGKGWRVYETYNGLYFTFTTQDGFWNTDSPYYKKATAIRLVKRAFNYLSKRQRGWKLVEQTEDKDA